MPPVIRMLHLPPRRDFRFAPTRVDANRIPYPLRWKNLLAIPDPSLEIQSPEARVIAGRRVEPTRNFLLTFVGIETPGCSTLGSNSLPDFLLGIRGDGLAGRARNHDSEQLGIGILVLPVRSRLRLARRARDSAEQVCRVVDVCFVR